MGVLLLILTLVLNQHVDFVVRPIDYDQTKEEFDVKKRIKKKEFFFVIFISKLKKDVLEQIR